MNRKVKKLQIEVNKINKDGNIYNNLNSISEISNTQKIKQHFTKTVTTQQCKEALSFKYPKKSSQKMIQGNPRTTNTKKLTYTKQAGYNKKNKEKSGHCKT